MRNQKAFARLVGFGAVLVCAAYMTAEAVAAELISAPASAALMPPNGNSWYPTASDDGRWVIFVTESDNLVAGDSNGHMDIIRIDRQTGARVIASQADGTPANGPVSWIQPDISNDGRYVVFVSHASNLVPGDDNDRADLFRKDLQTGAILRISPLTQSSSEPFGLSLTGDGNTLLFMDDEASWNSGANNERRIIRVDWRTLQISVFSTQEPLSAYGRMPISSDGRCLVYRTLWETHERIRVRNLQTGVESWGDHAVDGAAPNGSTVAFAIDANCTAIGFVSAATNLFGSQTEKPFHVYRRTLGGNSQLEKVSERSPFEDFTGGTQMMMSADGRHFVYTREMQFDLRTWAFWTEYRDLAQPFAQRADWLEGTVHAVNDQGAVLTRSNAAVPGDLNELYDVHLSPSVGAPMQLLAAPIEPLPVMAADGGSLPSYPSRRTEFGDGNWVAFDSRATNLVEGVVESDTLRDVFLRDRSNGQTQRLLSAFAIEPTDDVHLEDISADGRFVVLSSCDSHLVANDNNDQCDVFVADRAATTIEFANVDSNGVQADFEYGVPRGAQITDDGRFVVFVSMASNLSPEPPSRMQVYIRDRVTSSTWMALQGVAGALNGGSSVFDVAHGGHYALLWYSPSEGPSNCRAVGVDLLTRARDCPVIDTLGAEFTRAGTPSISADGRFLLYFDPFDDAPEVLLHDRARGQVRTITLPADQIPGSQTHFLSGNGRYLLAISENYGQEYFLNGVYDLILERWVAPPAVMTDTFGISINHSGTAVSLGTMMVLDGADLNGGVPDFYRQEYTGEGVFGGGWQGGFE